MKINKDLAIPAPSVKGIGIVSEGPSEDRYPEVHLETKEGLGLPKSGTITFRYDTESETSRKGSYSCTLSLRSVVSADGEKDARPSKRDTSAEDALDALAKEKSKAKEEPADEGY